MALLVCGCAFIAPEPIPATSPGTRPNAIAQGPQTPTPPIDRRAHAAEQIEKTQAIGVWDRIQRGLTFNGIQHAAVKRELQWFLANRDFFNNTSRRALPYLYFIVEAIEQRGLPVEIALLPIVESGYQYQARSPHGASGIWQFMPATGRRFGLKQTRSYDGRRDIVAATHAALDYLALLHERFAGDWLLALAAYNCGPTTVDRAIARNRRRGEPVDFWSLVLPRETRHHVPRLLAVTEIVRHAGRYGINFNSIPNTPYFAEVDLGGPLDLRKIPEWAGISNDEFKALNPAFEGWYTDPGGPYSVLVPHSTRAAVMQALASLPPEQRFAAQEYTVRSGDTLGGIAQRFTTSVSDIQRANGLRGHLIRPRQTLMIPAPGSGHMGPAVPSAGRDTNVHVVRRGDTLWDIARLYDKRVEEIAKHNGMLTKATLRPGQRLAIPGYITAEAGAPDEVAHYRVRKGDSLWTISRRFRVSLQELMAWNNLSHGRYLQPGQRLVVLRATGSKSPI